MNISTICLTSVNIHKDNRDGSKEHQWNPTHWMDFQKSLFLSHCKHPYALPPSMSLKIQEIGCSVRICSGSQGTQSLHLEALDPTCSFVMHVFISLSVKDATGTFHLIILVFFSGSGSQMPYSLVAPFRLGKTVFVLLT